MDKLFLTQMEIWKTNLATHQLGNNKKQAVYPFVPKLGTIQERKREKKRKEKKEKKELK